MPDAPPRIRELVETFARNVETYRSGQYNEAQVRREFIDPFFVELGWDVHNEQGYAHAYKHVIHEDALKVGAATKAPDYSFRIGGVRKFFLEAKKPSIDIKGDPHPAYQLRRYAWSAKLPLSILTDFEEFAVYDCRTRPRPTDRASAARIMFIRYDEYPKRWHEIAAIFSREAILKGSFDKFAQSRRQKGTAEVDVAFLAEIEKWRDMLARNIALRNPHLTGRQLNFAVQITIDRIIFLRMCEDRGIETYAGLQSILPGDRVYRRLCERFETADKLYNSGLFHFEPEKGRNTPPDELTLALDIDDKDLKYILNSLYYPQCPYEFSVLPPEILGNVYEQFLGKVITLTSGHRARIEEKPEVKKAGGVYYTPSYIVDYIVQNTVGKLIEGRTPRQVADLRILDPACGSGSFLLGAYTRLLDYHRDWYTGHDPESWARKSKPPIRQIDTPLGPAWVLTVAEKKRILLNNIFGVDIGSQAVEVTKLSLLLKVLEGETAETLGSTRKLFHERALPDLGGNIKCGNSLIAPDFFERLDPKTITDDLREKVNAFDWKTDFPGIFKRKDPGFDAVIGNPPYIRIQTLKDTQPESVPYFSQQYVAASRGNYDIYVVFVEKALGLLNATGLMGYILPHKFLNASYGQQLRTLLADGKHLLHLVHFGDQQVFTGATTYTCLLFLSSRSNSSFTIARVTNLLEWQSDTTGPCERVCTVELSASEWNLTVGPLARVFAKLENTRSTLGDIANIFVGTQTSADSVFVLDDCHRKRSKVIGTSRLSQKSVTVETSIVRPFLKGRDIRRYQPAQSTSCLICPYSISADSFALIPESTLRRTYPLAYSYLRDNKAALIRREANRFDGPNWYAFGYPKSMTLFGRPKIIVPDYNNMASYTTDLSGHFYKTGYGIIPEAGIKESLNYLLGLLNSKLLFAYLTHVGTTLRGGYIRFWTQFTSQLPIRRIAFDDPADKSRHDKMVALVQTMLDLNKSLETAKTPHEQTVLKRQITATDNKIDRLTYELYNLTDEEIAIIEQSTSRE